ncbi:Protein of uncharacterised function (DUF2874) [Porphyromonas macacae]|uniref:Protein of uncharacterized function (DUF2874) n=1 Tax=Porphyromonas macacae TaxID=28115 RepID=A0A379EGL3_9PORP|nr:PepSY-like domain-containing protein [Porphyromonas macacae]SUB98082.1 Protein of uncharacterised function (DUF2874) [Porphyromonas macacae]
MIKKHFPNQTVSFVKMDRDWLSKSYEVVFSNGDKIEFDKSGDWIDIDCEYTSVPTELIPARIIAQVSAKLFRSESNEDREEETAVVMRSSCPIK